jgi:hypothetical protein
MITDEGIVSVELPPELYEILSRASKHADTDVSNYATRVVLEYLRNVKEEARAEGEGTVTLE